MPGRDEELASLPLHPTHGHTHPHTHANTQTKTHTLSHMSLPPRLTHGQVGTWISLCKWMCSLGTSLGCVGWRNEWASTKGRSDNSHGGLFWNISYLTLDDGWTGEYYSFRPNELTVSIETLDFQDWNMFKFDDWKSHNAYILEKTAMKTDLQL